MIQDRVRRAKRSTAEAPQSGKDEVISSFLCQNKLSIIPCISSNSRDSKLKHSFYRPRRMAYWMAYHPYIPG